MATTRSPQPEIAIPESMGALVGRINSAIGRTATDFIVTLRDSGRLKRMRWDGNVRFEESASMRSREFRRVQAEDSAWHQTNPGVASAFPGAQMLKAVVERDYVGSLGRKERTELNTGSVAAEFAANPRSSYRELFQIGLSTDAQIAGPTKASHLGWVTLNYQSLPACAAAIGAELGEESEAASRDLLIVAGEVGLVIAHSMVELGATIGQESVPSETGEIADLMAELDKIRTHGQSRALRPEFVWRWVGAQAA